MQTIDPPNRAHRSDFQLRSFLPPLREYSVNLIHARSIELINLDFKISRIYLDIKINDHSENS